MAKQKSNMKSYDKPSRTLHKSDSGSDVRGLEDGCNQVFKAAGLSQRISKDSHLHGDFNKISLAAQFCGVPTESQKKIDKSKSANRRVDERAQNMIRNPGARSKSQQEKGEKRIARYKKDAGKEEVKAKDLGPNSQITKNFKVSDFDCTSGAKVPPESYDGLIRLVTGWLQPLRDESGGSVSINSGYRDEAFNRSIGGASASMHIFDYGSHAANQEVAADIVSSKWSPSKVHSWMDQHGIGGLGSYVGFTHVDCRRSPARWNGGY